MTDSSCPKRQAGALVLLVPLIITVCGIVAILAVEGARLFMAQAELQSQVKAAASAAVGATQACGGEVVGLEPMKAAALSAAKAQRFRPESGTLDVFSGALESDEDNILSFRGTAVAQSDSALAVIRSTEPVSRVVPGLFGSVELEASAAVRKQVLATISAAGSTAGIDGGLFGNLIGGLLGQSNYQLDVTDMASLENTMLGVGVLLDASGVDSLGDLLALSGSSLAQAVRSVAGISSPAGTLANDLLSVPGIKEVKVSDLIDLAEGANPPENTAIRAYDLLIGLALSAAKELQGFHGGGIAIDAFQVLDLPFIDEIDQDQVELRLVINQPPTLAIGPAKMENDGAWVTEFHAADISLEIQALYRQTGSTAEGVLLPGVRYTVLDTPMNLAIALGGGRGQLVSAKCARGNENEVSIAVDIQRTPAVFGTGEIDATGAFQLLPQTKVLRLTVEDHGVEQAFADVQIEYSVQGRVTVADERREFSGYALNCRGDDCRISQYANADSAENAVDATLSPVIHSVNVDLLGTSLPGPSAPIVEDAVRQFFEMSLAPTVQAVGYNLLNVLVKPTAQATGISFGGVQVSLDAAAQVGTQFVEGVVAVQL